MKYNKLKGCPFCGAEVEFDRSAAIYNASFHGVCSECGMVFEYTEKHEELTHDYPALGEKRVYYNIMVPKNPPFEDAWNRRATNERSED